MKNKLYNNFLLNNKDYKEKLKKEYKYLIVDSLENSSVSEGNLIDELMQSVEDAYIFYDKSKDYSSFKNVDIKYIEEKTECNIKYVSVGAGRDEYFVMS